MFLNSWGIDAEIKTNTRRNNKIAREKHIAEFKQAISQAEIMAHNVRNKGIKDYKTLDELLVED